MSEPVLKAIMRLFALVAKEDKVTQQERDHIQVFLADHLNQKAVNAHLQLFDDYSNAYSGTTSVAKEQETIKRICSEINLEIAQKQRLVIIVELMTIILADGTISEREDLLAQAIGKALNVSQQDIELIKLFIKGRSSQEMDNENLLIIESAPANTLKSKRIVRAGLDGLVSVLYVKSSEMYFIKYQGKTDV